MSMERDLKKNPKKFWKYANWDIRIKNKYIKWGQNNRK